MNKLLIILLFSFISIPTLFAQKDEEKEMFLDGEYFVLHKEFPDALPFYLQLIDKYPDNANLNFRAGLCYLNIQGGKDKAIPYFEKAINNLTNRYKEGDFNEKKAPYDAYFYLANAYQINNEIIKAKQMYEKHLTFHHPADTLNINFVKKQIESCKNAKKLKQNKTHFDSYNLGQNINDAYNNYYPGISQDGNTIVFMTGLKFYDAIMLSKKIDGKWTMPVNLTPQIKSDGDLYISSLSANGQTLYMTKNDNLNSDIYVSYFKDNVWTNAVKLNMNINTKYWESYASESPDGSTLYFSSSRIKGYGGLDIYKSKKNPLTGDWGNAVNLGPVVNTCYSEDCPSLTRDGKKLYFSSQGHENLGGFDIFYTEKSVSDNWTKPVNIGYPINSTDDDIFFSPHNNGTGAYYSIFGNEDSYGGKDIYYLNIYSDNNPRKVKIKGVVIASGFTAETKGKINIDILESATSRKIASPKAKLPSGKFVYSISKPGKYEVIASVNGYSDGKTEFIIPSDYSIDEINIKTELKPVKKEETYKTDKDDREFLYYTVQLMALYNPVDVSFFAGIDDVKVAFGKDQFYRYTTGILKTYKEAKQLRKEIRKMGYADDIFIRKVTRELLKKIEGGNKK
jgi:tetratricopeptide (TPR) repeat protein